MLDQYPIKALTLLTEWKSLNNSSYQWLLNLPSSLYALASDHSNESSVTGSKKKVDTTKSSSLSYY